MPYIIQERRDDIIKGGDCARKVGELTFIIQYHLKEYFKFKGESYQTYAEMLGALRGAEIDVITRKLIDYEAKKCKENGDVWE